MTKQRLAVLILIVVAVGLFSALVVPTIISRRHTQQAQAQQDAAGRDIRKQGQAIDVMHKALSDRIISEAMRADSLHLSPAEKRMRVNAVYNAGTSEIKRVRDSNYTKPFDTTVFDRALQQIHSSSAGG